MAVPAAVTEFTRKLRWLGMDVSAPEAADALRAISDADLLHRGKLHGRLQVTLVKRAADIPAFHAAFDLLFPALDSGGGTGGQVAPTAHADAATEADGEPASPDLLTRLVSLLRGDSATSMSEFAAEVISTYGGLGEGQVTGSQRYYEYRIMRQLDLSALLQRAMRLDNGTLWPGPTRRMAGLEQQERMQELRAEIAAQLRDHLAELRGFEASLRQLKESVLDTEFLRAGPAELDAMRAVVAPLARRLAAMARRRKRLGRVGKLDVRRTMRRAIAVGGVPIDPAWRRRRRPRPKLLVLCDGRDRWPSSRSSPCPCCTRCTRNCPGSARSSSPTASPR
jgi:uncharacterized protein with von Willebrand factor type A (vWA) domain